MTDTRTTLKDAHGALMALWIASGESGSGVSLILHGLRTLIASLEAAEPVAYVTAYGVIVEHGLPLEPGQQLYAHPAQPVEQHMSTCESHDQEIAATVCKARDALQWFVDNDDTNIGQPGNEFWEEGLNEGIAAIAAIEAVRK